MFNLENAIQSWKQSLEKSPAFEEGQIKEMETHFRDHIDHLVAEGLPEEEAFHRAAEKFGAPEELEDEVYKTKTTKVDATPPWKQKTWVPNMLPNYIKTIFRNFKRQKSSFLINTFGLAIGLACSILILMWVKDEMSVDRFHEDVNRIYQVMEHQQYAVDNIFTTTSTPGPLAPVLENEFPGIERAATYTRNSGHLFTLNGETFNESGIYARPAIFDIFTIEILLGNEEELLSSPDDIAISRSLSQKYFGNENPIGESIVINRNELYTVSGVFEDLPENSTLRFDFVIPFEVYLSYNPSADTWGSNGPYTVVKINESEDPASLDKQIKELVKERNEGSVVELFLFPYADQYLYRQFENGQRAGGRIQYVRLFSIVAFFILLIACINFMNLSTARASRSSKEVGIRKSVGATQGSLIGRYIGESVIISFIALLLSIFVVELAMPWFNNLTGKQITLDYFEPGLLLLLLGITLVTGLLAGSYPAFYLSSFNAVNVLKGKISTARGEFFIRKGLVVFQFALSVILIVATLVIYQQVQFIMNKNLGYEKENLVYVNLSGGVQQSWDVFKEEVKQLSGVRSVSRSNHPFLWRNSNGGGFTWPGKNPEANILIEYASVGYDLIETMGMNLIAGRNFSREYGAETGRIIINQKAAEVMEMEQPVGQVITSSMNAQYEIIGVVENFHFVNLQQEIPPMFMFLGNNQMWRAFIRIENDQMSETLSSIEENYKQIDPDYTYSYHFMDQQYASLYRSEMRIGELAKYFGIFAIFISCLGLFGLSAFMAERRNKEIGIRKTLGASAQSIVLLLSREFTKLVLIAIGLSLPLSLWLMIRWLSQYAYQVEVGWWVFVAACLLVLIVAWITTGYQSLRAALIDPVESLRSE